MVFDTGHQAYVHKLLTGRAGAFLSKRRIRLVSRLSGGAFSASTMMSTSYSPGS